MIDYELAARIDHTLLKPASTREDILRVCDEAKKLRTASVCVNSYWAPVVAAALALKAAFGAGFFRCLSRHYCCTSLSLVERSCRILKTATSTKKMTAFACPTPRLRALA